MRYLLDTNVLSELRRTSPNPKVTGFLSSLPIDDLYISIVTIAEIRFGIDILADPVRRAEFSEWLTLTVRPTFDQRILPITEDIMLKWRLLVEEGRKAGHTFSQPDLLIAATAIQHGMVIATRNRRDFEKASVPVVNPWEDDL